MKHLTITDFPLVLAAVACFMAWATLGIRVAMRSDSGGSRLSPAEKLFLGANCAVALLLASFIHPSAAADAKVVAGPAPVASGCMSAEASTWGREVRAKLGAPTRIVSEEDTRGPEATAWVFEQKRCVVHLLADRVESFEYDDEP
jgi:hypothetical protein